MAGRASALPPNCSRRNTRSPRGPHRPSCPAEEARNGERSHPRCQPCCRATPCRRHGASAQHLESTGCSGAAAGDRVEETALGAASVCGSSARAGAIATADGCDEPPNPTPMSRRQHSGWDISPRRHDPMCCSRLAHICAIKGSAATCAGEGTWAMVPVLSVRATLDFAPRFSPGSTLNETRIA